MFPELVCLSTLALGDLNSPNKLNINYVFEQFGQILKKEYDYEKTYSTKMDPTQKMQSRFDLLN